MYSAYKLNKQGNSIQPDVLLSQFRNNLLFRVQLSLLLLDLHTDFSEGRYSGLVFPSLYNFPQFVVIHTVKGFGIVNKAEVGIFLDLSCFFSFFDDPMDVGNLISGSSGFYKSTLNIWNFSVYILLKSGLENCEHYFAIMWNDCNWMWVWANSRRLWRIGKPGMLQPMGSQRYDLK